MAKILEGQTLEVEKMYCFRGKILQREAEQVGKDMEHTIAQLGAKMAAHPITAIYGIEGDQIDMEIRIPIDQEIPSVGKYFYKAKMKIVNAAVATHKGNPASLQMTCNELNQYLQEKQLVPITVGYTVTKKTDVVNMDNTEMEVYVGISPNVL